MLLLFNNENAYHIIMKIIIEKPENQRNNINLCFVYNIEKIIINPYRAYCWNKFVLNKINLNLRLILMLFEIIINNKNSFIILNIKY